MVRDPFTLSQTHGRIINGRRWRRGGEGESKGWHSQWLTWVNRLAVNSGRSSNVSNVLFKLFTNSSKAAQS